MALPWNEDKRQIKKLILYSVFTATNLFTEIAVKYNNLLYYHATFISVYNIRKIRYGICRKDLYPPVIWWVGQNIEVYQKLLQSLC